VKRKWRGCRRVTNALQEKLHKCVYVCVRVSVRKADDWRRSSVGGKESSLSFHFPTLPTPPGRRKRRRRKNSATSHTHSRHFPLETLPVYTHPHRSPASKNLSDSLALSSQAISQVMGECSRKC
jgi:hypothetical protein